MPLTITKLKMWKDPGYTRGCLEIPPVGSKKLPTPDYTLPSTQTLRPHKDSTLTALNLPLSFTQIFGMSYLYIEASDGAGSIALFGWVDSVTQRATAAEEITLQWSVDWWRSYSQSAVLGTGRVLRCSDSTYERPYRTQPRFWKTKYSYVIRDSRHYSSNAFAGLWCYLLVVWNKISTVDPNETMTVIRTMFAPVSGGFKETPGSQTATPVNLNYIFEGKMDEFVNNIALYANTTASIIGGWLAPFAPRNFTFDNSTNIWTCDDSTSYDLVTDGGVRCMMMTKENMTLDIHFSMNLGLDKIDNTHRIALTDFNGNIAGYIPFGTAPSGIKGYVDIGTEGAYMNIRFFYPADSDIILPGQTVENYSFFSIAPSVGCGFTIPLPKIPINENQWSDYMLTGQRDFDITSARIANEKQAISGLESSVSSAIGGGVTGAVAGPAGAISGIVGGGLVSGAMTGINYLLGENFNDQMQDAKDRLYANQKNGIILTGSGKFRISEAKMIYPFVIEQIPDDTFVTEYTNDITNNGYETNLMLTDISSFISTGPYKIDNMTVTGKIPPQAKQYIKDKFASGIRIVENNPSGVVP